MKANIYDWIRFHTPNQRSIIAIGQVVMVTYQDVSPFWYKVSSSGSEFQIFPDDIVSVVREARRDGQKQ